MKSLIASIFAIGIFSVPSLAADEGRIEGSVKTFTDYVKLRYMPSRGAFMEREPVTELRGESHTTIVIRDGKVMGTNDSIKELFHHAKVLHDKGIKSNQQEFHVSSKTIEVSYMGKKIALEYAGPSKQKKYRQYEKDWLALYDLAYQFLTRDIQP